MIKSNQIKLPLMIMKNRLFTVAEYFAGIGLMRMGFESVGWRVIWANDISAKKFEMYGAFFPDATDHYVVGSIFDIDPDSVPPTALATCSFPCIDLSLAGNMGGIRGRHSSAFWGFINILKAQGDHSPPFVIIENVPGWLHSNQGADFRVTIEALNNLGYACDVFTLDAIRFRPQSRMRVFLIGAKFNDNEDWHRIVNRSHSLLSKRLKASILANIDLRWFYNDIPKPPGPFTSGLSGIVENLNDSDERWWSDEEVNRHLQMMDQAHYQRVLQISARNEISYRTFFRRIRKGQQRAEVRNDDLSGCLRTAIGGSGKQFLVSAGKGKIKMRAMTPREYARLQGVPDEFPITVNGVQALTGFGDAVCVPAIKWIAQNALNPLAKQNVLQQFD